MVQFNLAAESILRGGIMDTFAGFGQAIGQSLANGTSVLKAAGGALLNSLGDLLSQFGKLVLAAGVASLALGKALRNPLNPKNAALAIAGGTALLAVGAAVKSFAQKAQGASGGDSLGGSISSGSSQLGRGSRGSTTTLSGSTTEPARTFWTSST